MVTATAEHEGENGRKRNGMFRGVVLTLRRARECGAEGESGPRTPEPVQ